MPRKAPASKGTPRRAKSEPAAPKKGSGTPTYPGKSGNSRTKAPGRKKSSVLSRARAFRAEAERQLRKKICDK